VCSRLGLNCLSYLWSRDQAQLLEEILACQIDSVLVKVASIGKVDSLAIVNLNIKKIQRRLVVIL